MKNSKIKYNNSIEKSPGKKALIYFLILALCNWLIIKYFFASDNSRFLALLGFLVGLFALFKFSAKLAGVFVHRDLRYSDVTSVEAQNDKQIAKGTYFTLLFLLALIGAHIYGFHRFTDYQKEQLEKNGVFVRSIVNKKKREHREKNSPAKYYIYYSYRYKNKDYHQNSASEQYEVGDTITVKLLPDNPDNHIIVEVK